MTVIHPDHDRRCRDLLERLSMYLDDELPAPDRRTLETHLRDCPCCGDVLESLRQTVVLCHEDGRPELPPEVRARARARVAELLQRQPPRVRRARRARANS
jgi:anti-sigma factor RsiW